MRHFSLQWQVVESRRETFDTNSNEHTNAPNAGVLIFDVKEAVSTLSLQTNRKQKDVWCFWMPLHTRAHVYVNVSYRDDGHLKAWNDVHNGLDLGSVWFRRCLRLNSVIGPGPRFLYISFSLWIKKDSLIKYKTTKWLDSGPKHGFVGHFVLAYFLFIKLDVLLTLKNQKVFCEKRFTAASEHPEGM